jgi:hypothetical protein
VAVGAEVHKLDIREIFIRWRIRQPCVLSGMFRENRMYK